MGNSITLTVRAKHQTIKLKRKKKMRNTNKKSKEFVLTLVNLMNIDRGHVDVSYLFLAIGNCHLKSCGN